MNTILINGLHFPDYEKHFQTLPTSLSKFDRVVFRWLNRHTKNVYIDVGAHVGTTILQYWRLYKKIIAFEPSQENFHCLQLNTRNIKHLDRYNMALGAEEITGFVDKKNTNSGGVSISPQGQEVQIKKLDSFCFEDVSYIKIDTQGYDLNVLLGAEQTIDKWQPLINVEDGVDLPRKYRLPSWGAKQFLIDKGYTQVSGTSKTFLFVPKRIAACYLI